QDLTANWRDGRIKFALIRKLLAIRGRYPALFRDGNYAPLQSSGRHADHALGFVRAAGRQRLIVVVARHFAPLTERGRRWPSNLEIELDEPIEGYVDVITGQDAQGRPADLFGPLPIAVLIKA